jgi:hypothetical protein
VKTQGGVRAPFSGLRGAKSSAAVVGPGSKDHRILRRVPTDGRHPGLQRITCLHGYGMAAISAALSRSEKHREGGLERAQEREATGMSEAR